MGAENIDALAYTPRLLLSFIRISQNVRGCVAELIAK